VRHGRRNLTYELIFISEKMPPEPYEIAVPDEVLDASASTSSTP